MLDFTLHELICLDAVACEGSFHAAADRLNRSHPAVHASIKSLESHLGVRLLDRSGYRVRLTAEGEAFHRRAKEVLSQADHLQEYAKYLVGGEETDLTVVIGDLCPTARVARMLQRFFTACPNTRLHLGFENLGGPWERLLERSTDIILHHVDPADSRFETINLFPVVLEPVVAPGFLDFPISDRITAKELKSYAQCIIRDTAKQSSQNYLLIEGAHSWTVGDQATKKELIMLGMGWGHLPRHLIEEELTTGKLVSIAGNYIQRVTRHIVAARLRENSYGPIANQLWNYLSEARDE